MFVFIFSYLDALIGWDAGEIFRFYRFLFYIEAFFSSCDSVINMVTGSRRVAFLGILRCLVQAG